MTKEQEPTFPVSDISPAAMPQALRARLLRAMQSASDEVSEFAHEEALLRKLRPAPMAPAVRSRMGVRMYLSAMEIRRALRYGFASWRRISAVAAALALCCTGGGMLLVSDAAADTSQGVMSRSVIETRGGDSVRWGADAVPVHCYEVTYEDTFVMDADADMRVMVSVPNRAEVMVPADLL